MALNILGLKGVIASLTIRLFYAVAFLIPLFVFSALTVITLDPGTPAYAGESFHRYDEFGRLIRSIDEQNRVTDYIYDPAGNLLEARTNIPERAPTVASLTPNSIRRAESFMVQAVGTDLLDVSIAASDPGLVVSDIQRFTATATGIRFRLTASTNAVLGQQALTFSNTAGFSLAFVTVNPLLPKPSFVPGPLAVPPDSSARQFTLRLSHADTIAHTLAFAVANTAIASVTPSMTIPAGQTGAMVSITGLQAGQTVLSWTSSTLGNASDVLYITNEYTEMQRAYSSAVRVNLLAPPQSTTTTIDPVVSPLVRIHVTAFPTASAGLDQSVNEGAAVTLSGSGTDPDGTVAAYAWTQIAGPPVTLAGANTATASFVAPAVIADTLLTFRLTVTDNLGATASASVNVTVKNVPSQPPVADAGGPYAGGTGIALPLDGALSKDPENQPLTYRWNFGDGATGTGVAPTHTYAAAGTYVVTLVVNDGEQDSAPALTGLLVAPVVAGSVAVAIQPSSATVAPSTAQRMAVTGTNATGVTLSRLTIEYSYSSSSLLVTGLTTSPIPGTATIDTTARRVKLAWTNVPHGVGVGATFAVASPIAATYALNPAKVEYVLADNVIRPLTANSATVQVSTTGNKAPSVSASANQAVNEGTLVQLQGSATDTDGVVVNYFWQQTAGPAVILSNTSSRTPTFTAPLVAADTVLSFRLFAIDNAWATGAASTSVTVKNVP